MNTIRVTEFEKYVLDNYKEELPEIAAYGRAAYLDKIANSAGLDNDLFYHCDLLEVYNKYCEDLHDRLRVHMKYSGVPFLEKLLQSMEYAHTFQSEIIWFAIEQIANIFVTDSSRYSEYRTKDNQPKNKQPFVFS